MFAHPLLVIKQVLHSNGARRRPGKPPDRKQCSAMLRKGRAAAGKTGLQASKCRRKASRSVRLRLLPQFPSPLIKCIIHCAGVVASQAAAKHDTLHFYL